MVGRKENLPILPSFEMFTVKFAVEIPLESSFTSVMCNKVFFMYPVVFCSSHAPGLVPGPAPACWAGAACWYQPVIGGY